jgi:hypothetical protein
VDNSAERPTVVGLVGWFWRGNFGDDLMAALFGVELRRAGFAIVTWALALHECQAFGFASAATVEALVEMCDVIIYAGGGMLTRAHRQMEDQNGFGQSMTTLCDLCATHKVPFFLLSVGGDGDAPDINELSAVQLKMIRSAALITVRNEQDLAAPAAANPTVPIFCFPDIVWRTKTVLQPSLNRAPAQSPRPTLLFHSFLGLERVLLSWAWWWGAGRRGRVATICSEHYAHISEQANTIQHSSVLATLETLRAANGLITPRLHLGMAALAIGTPVGFYLPEAKVRMAIAGIGLSQHLVTRRRHFLKLLWRLSQSRLLAALPESHLAALSAAAHGHIAAAIAAIRKSPRAPLPTPDFKSNSTRPID